MAYNDNIPNSGDLVSMSQGQIKANFQGIDSTVFGFARNHVALTDGTNGGLHKRVDYQAAVGDPTLGAFVSSLYPKGGSVDLFYKNASAVYQLTNLPITTSGGSHFVVTPWGLKFSWGKISSVTSGGTAVSFPASFSQIPECDLYIT